MQVIRIKNLKTGKIFEIEFGIQKMKYHNELILCESWGYDNGQPTWQNDPENYEIISIDGWRKEV